VIIKEKPNMKWKISLSNTEFSPWLLHKGTILNIKKRNMINNEDFGRKEKISNQMNIIIKIKDFLRNLINIIKNMITINLIIDKKKTKCFKCGKYGHFAIDYKVKQKINQLQINEKEKEDLNKLLELRNTDSETEISPYEIETSSDEYSSSSSSTPDIKIGCTDNCCANKSINVLTKSLNVLTKQEEQEELLLEAISKINDPEFKASMLQKLRKMLNKKEATKDDKLPKPTISLSETLKRFNKLKPKKINLENLQSEVNQIKKEIIQLKVVNEQLESKNAKLEGKNAKLEDRVSVLELDKIFKPINNDSSSKDDKPESPTRRMIKSDDEIRYCNLLNKITPIRWHTNVKLIIEDHEIEVIVLVNTGADLKCIQEGLIPTKYFEKSTERLNSTNGSKMHIKI
jgi:hypothetical protein